MNESRPSVSSTRKGDVRLQLAVEPFAKVAGGEELPSSPVSGRVVDREQHAQRRLVDLDPGQGDRGVGRGDGVADVDRPRPRRRRRGRRLRPPRRSIRPSFSKTRTPSAVQGLVTPSALSSTISFWPLRTLPRGDPADGDPADVLGEVERRAEHLERAVGLDQRAGDALDDQVEQRLDVARGRVRVVRGEPALARGEDVPRSRAAPRPPRARRSSRRSR